MTTPTLTGSNPNQQPFDWSPLPQDVKKQIVRRLPVDDLLFRLKNVSKEFYVLANDDMVWEEILRHQMPNVRKIENLTWKKTYIKNFDKVTEVAIIFADNIFKMLFSPHAIRLLQAKTEKTYAMRRFEMVFPRN